MKHKLLPGITVLALLSFPVISFAQAPVMGTAADFVLFSSVGAVTNTGNSSLTGNIGTNSGSSTGFGNVDGQMHDNDGVSAQCSADLLIAYNQLNALTPTLAHAPLLGNGETLVAGVYTISAASTINLDLYLDGGNDPNALFVFKIQGPLSTSMNTKVKVINGTLACNVFWKVEGLVNVAPNTTMRGTVIANNAAITLSAGDTLIGRALSTNGAVSITSMRAAIPSAGCNAPVLTGPAAPQLGTAACYALFSSSGTLSNSGATYVTGDIGTNNGTVTGYNAANVNGTIHPGPDASTAQCAADLSTAYTYLNALQHDIELLYPAQFGNGLVLTPHTYLLDAATVFSDTLYLNAQGNSNAVFVIKVNGAFSSSITARVVLMNNAQSKNVYWKVDGAVLLDDSTVFRGTLICNNGSLGAINTGVLLDGRALTTTGALTTTAVNVVATMIPGNCSTLGVQSRDETSEVVTVYPNPFSTSSNIQLNNASQINSYEMKIYTVAGQEVMDLALTVTLTTISTSALAPGIYFYKITDKNNMVVQSGKLISQQ